jgi:hypothetical protein
MAIRRLGNVIRACVLEISANTFCDCAKPDGWFRFAMMAEASVTSVKGLK